MATKSAPITKSRVNAPTPVKEVAVFAKGPNSRIGTTDAYKARVDSTNKVNIAKDANLRKATGRSR
jgi:hypothetical protein